ncbi:hypothetical protein DIS24_g3436 [Lasiodiplodia hormozganensis]|uniref:BZIP domain-containing protein n=1 Tax=Lasiodiplodia hormozganensis TaxID=869390 RepID=A0AA40D4H9_9PEZI|nr:hypothetical protein DIS24_g3436 [Lasiodiplodia hormozganensis]
MSQQAFRQRQVARIKDLERRLERAASGENERVAELEEENRRLREQLTVFINKLASAQASLQRLSRLMQDALGESSTTDQAEESLTSHEPPVVDQNCEVSVPFDNASSELLQNQHTGDGAELTLCDQVPGIWSYGYQMGPRAYRHAMECSPPPRDGRPIMSNSLFSDHISSLQGCILTKWQHISSQQPADATLHKLQQSVSIMLSMFHGLTRPFAMSWYTWTKWYNHISDMMTWQLNPTREMYAHLHPRYRPSALQLSASYPTYIDWCPFPAVRDKLILMHAANPLIDDMLLDMAYSYCVETDLSQLVSTSHQPMPGYVRVWDIIQAMGDDDDDDHHLLSHTATTLPAPSAAAIFQSPVYARLVFHLLRMDDGVSVYKLDPAVFSKHPELYSPELADVMASGVPLQPPSPHIPIPPTVNLDPDTLKVYRHFADWSLDAICNTRW